MPVLAVTDAKCIGKGVNSGRCTGHIPHMLGVGFGRGTTAQTSPAYNPLLNLTEMAAGTMRRGYLIARGGLSLGLTEANVVGAWAMQPLVNARRAGGRNPQRLADAAGQLPDRGRSEPSPARP